MGEQAFQFHIATAYYVLSALYVVVPFVIWHMLSGFQLREATWWCGGGMLIGVGTFLIERTNPSSHFAIYTIAGPAAIFIGLQLKSKTLQSILHQPLHKHRLLMWTGLYIALDLIIANIASINEYRRLFYWSSHVMLYTYLTYLAWRVKNVKRSKSAQWIFFGYALVVALLLAIPLSKLAVTELMWREGTPAIFLVMTGIFILFTNHIAFMGIILENSWSGERIAKEESLKNTQKSMLKNMLWVTEREKLLANVSRKIIHEVNQSLTSLSATVHLLQRAEKDQRLHEVDAAGLLQRMSFNIHTTTEVMNHVRPLAKDRSIHRTHCYLEKIIRDGIEISDVPKYIISVDFNAPASLSLIANEIELIRVMVNLLKNAYQASCSSAAEPCVHVTVNEGHQQAIIVIRDNGAGFGEEAMQKAGKQIFTTKSDGMGIGLWMCQEIVERHGGEIVIGNQPNSGASITLKLPCAS